MPNTNAELLIRLDTSVLDARLKSLSEELGDDLRNTRSMVSVCEVNVKSVAADVDAIQRFLLSYHNREMLTALSANSTAGRSDVAEVPLRDQLDRFSDTVSEARPTENIVGTVAAARCLLAENEALRNSLETATAALSNHSTGSMDIQGEVVQLRRQRSQQAAQLEIINSLLGISEVTEGDASKITSHDEPNSEASTAPSEAASSPLDTSSAEKMLSRSPLLLSFRQVLLRDLTERLTAVVERQSKDFRDSVSHLEERLRGQQGTAGASEAAYSGHASDLQENVRALTKRLRELDERVVRREEFTALMRAKADSLLLPSKADNASLGDLESRLLARIADLEERCALADAERAEFRALLRSLVVTHTSMKSSSASPAPEDSVQGAVGSMGQLSASARGAVMREVLPPLAGSTLITPPRREQNRIPLDSTSSSPQQLYRVIGAVPSSSVHGVSASSAAVKENSKPGSNGLASHEDKAKVNANPQSTAEGSAVAIGMTSTQGPYAAFVTQQLARRQVASLPVLPYESAAPPR